MLSVLFYIFLFIGANNISAEVINLKNKGLIILGTAMGVAAGAAAMAAVNCPKVKRACKMAQRKMTSCLKRCGI